MSVTYILEALNERTIAREFREHDEARISYHLASNQCRTYQEFETLLCDYFNFHNEHCETCGSRRYPRDQAIGRAKSTLEDYYHRHRNGNLMGAYRDSCDGTNGGLRVVLDTLADAIKENAIDAYTRNVFDTTIPPVDWNTKVSIIREIMDRFGYMLSPDILADPPEKYAHNYAEILDQIVRAIQHTASAFRRM